LPSTLEDKALKLLDRVPRRHPDAAFQIIDGEAMVVVARRAEVQVLNPVGTRLWELIDGERSVGQILEILREEYDVDEGALQEDVHGFIDTLDRNGMLLSEEGA
jgi:pyrroloquinoline quinone biosynthesis protein D